MAIPTKAQGGGNNSTAQNVFRITFSTGLSSAPKWEAYDSPAAFPNTGTALTNGNSIFTGTAGNSHMPMLSLVSTTNAAPSSSWKPVTPVAGAAGANRLNGQTNYVLDPTVPGAGGTVRFNVVLEVPSDVTTASTMNHDLVSRYTYTGAAPALTWAVNDAGGGGTEGVPVWTTVTQGFFGIRYCKAGTIGGGPYLFTIPNAGTLDSAEIWVTS